MYLFEPADNLAPGANALLYPWGKNHGFSRGQFFLYCERHRKDFSMEI